MIETPFTPWPDFTQEEADAVSRVLLSNRVNYWTGRECREFECEFAAWAGVEHAVALANGTVALDLALNVLGIGPGDEVVVAPRTFIASVSCVVNAGARPVFADVDRDSQNITAESIRAVLTPRTKAIICVHLAGMPCEMDEIMSLASKKNLYVIEDCAQAHGALYKGKSVGTIGDLGAWSFCQDKIITTGGEGGMLTTNRREWWEKAWSYKDHGKSWDAVYQRQHSPGFRWLHETFGTNWRLTEMQAAIGRIQLGRMPEWHAARTRHAEAIRAMARTLPALRVPELPGNFIHAWYKCYLFVRPEWLRSGWSRDRILEEIQRRGVPCYSGSCPEVYLEQAFESTDFRPITRLATAKELGETSLMFLVHPTLKPEEIRKTCDALQAVINLAIVQ
jgi:dTDP-4-amino-4,6-dideoxygalactose transaminase